MQRRIEVVQHVPIIQLAHINEAAVSNSIIMTPEQFHVFRLCFFRYYRACLEGKDSYDNMFDYMRALNDLLAGRKLSSGELFLLWLGGER